MSQQDQADEIIVNHKVLKQVADELLPSNLFRGIKSRTDATWKPRMVVLTVLLMLTSGKKTLSAGFQLGRKAVGKIFRWQVSPGSSYQGFVTQLSKWHFELKLAVMIHLQGEMQDRLSDEWTMHGFVVMACDGSRVELSRTASLEEAYSPKKKSSAMKKKAKPSRGKGKKAKKKTTKKKKKAKSQSAESIKKKANSPQMWLTLMWHVGSGLPYDWRTGPSDSSEREHVQQMLPNLPQNTLMTADAGFVGYEFWSDILLAGHDFVIRVGGNVKLLKHLGCVRQYDHTVYLWPNAAAKKKQPPLDLRLIELHDGRQPVYLVTNLPKSRLSDQHACEIYAARWGIELFFRTFKQTFGCRKLRSQAAANVEWELDWSLIGLWCICLLGETELAANGKDPTRLSAAKAIEAFQETILHYRVRPEQPTETLWNRLQAALLDDYERTSSKASRNFPTKKKRERTGPPKIVQATQQQIEAAKQLKRSTTQKHLTA